MFENSESYRQLLLFQYCNNAKTIDDFVMNIDLLKKSKQDGGFYVDIDVSDRDKLIDVALSLGSCITAYYLNEQIDKMLTKIDGITCKKPDCNGAVTWYYECSCGIYAWCEEHFDITVWSDHCDHDGCNPECCKRGHRTEEKTWAEVKSYVTSIDLFVEEKQQQGERAIFSVSLRHKTREEYCADLAYEIGLYYVRGIPDDFLEEMVFHGKCSAEKVEKLIEKMDNNCK